MDIAPLALTHKSQGALLSRTMFLAPFSAPCCVVQPPTRNPPPYSAHQGRSFDHIRCWTSSMDHSPNL